MREWKLNDGYRVLENPFLNESDMPDRFDMSDAAQAIRFHKQLSVYKATPLVHAHELAKRMHVREVLIKDESRRFSLNAFKGLGGSYAMFRILCDRAGLDPAAASMRELQDRDVRSRIGDIEFVTCTDGNHGKGVSWAAALFGYKAHVYMPVGSCEVRAEAIRRAGSAEAVITDMSYDDTVRFAEKMSREHGWILIQDTAWEGYSQIPEWIINGYLTMAYEIAEELEDSGIFPTHVFLQAGVGAMAGGMLACLQKYFAQARPMFVIVEPNGADCVYASILRGDGKAHELKDCGNTIMAGLNCGTPCALTWPIMRDHAGYFISCPDTAAEIGMRACAALSPRMISGESGAAGIGAAVVLSEHPDLQTVRADMGLSQDSVLLFINTEGDTDPDNYRRIVEETT